MGDKPCPIRRSGRRGGPEEAGSHLLAASGARPPGLRSALQHNSSELGLIVTQVKAHLDLSWIGRIAANEVEGLKFLASKSNGSVLRDRTCVI